MAFKGVATASPYTKQYVWMSGYMGQGLKNWIYVTADDAQTVVEGAGYFDGVGIVPNVQAGDIFTIMQVASISDSRSIAADIANGLVQISQHVVVIHSPTASTPTFDLTPAINSQPANVTYTYGG